MADEKKEAGKVPVIELRGVSKTFGEVRSLSGINFKVYPGEIVGLLGDNGAGKSTLVKTIMGYHRPDAGGQIFFKGKLIKDWSVARARELGIETVYQERALSEKQPIWRNMFMGSEPRTKWGLLDVKRMRDESARLMSEHMGFTSAAVHPDNVVMTMSGGEKQGGAITRALYFDAELVVLDEPVTTNADLTHFLRAVVTVRDGRSTARLTGPQSSGILTSMSNANALLVVPPDRRSVAAGETLNAILIGDDAVLAADFAL